MIVQKKDKKVTSFIMLVFFIILNLSLAQCGAFNEYNFTFNLHPSKVVNLSQVHGIKIQYQNFTGQILDEFLIKQPKEIDNVVQIIASYKTQNSTLNVSISTQIDPNQLLSAPQIDKVWIDSYTWPIKKNSLYYSQSIQSQSPQNQKISIVSAVYVPLTSDVSIQKILNDDIQLYVLLSTGLIQLISKSHQQLQVQKTYQYDSPHQNQKKWWVDAYLYHKNDRLHLFAEQNFYFVSLNEIDDGKQKKIVYGLYKLMGIGPVLKVVETNQLFVFTDKACYEIKNNEAKQVIDYSQMETLFLGSKNGFVDFTIFGKNIYFLNNQLGVIFYSQGKYTLLRIQHPELANGIDVQNETIMITYQIANEEYAEEYHLIESQKQLFVNKVYTYHSEEPINDILLFEKEMIINRGSQILHGIHSLSRKLPQAFHIQNQVLQSKSYSDQVIQVRPIWSSGWRLPGYMIVTEKSIELIEFQSHSGEDIQQKWISISSEISGILNFDIQFIGTCKKSSFYPPEYCSITKSVQLIVNDRVKEQITSWWLWLCIAVGSISLLSAIIVLICTYFSRKQNEFESLIATKKIRKQGSAVVEMSFENKSQITQEKQN